MDSVIQAEKVILNSQAYWKLVGLPHVIIKCEDTVELSEKISTVLSDYFERFPSEKIRLLTSPEKMHIPLTM